jgi:hypothetical protein
MMFQPLAMIANKKQTINTDCSYWLSGSAIGINPKTINGSAIESLALFSKKVFKLNPF